MYSMSSPESVQNKFSSMNLYSNCSEEPVLSALNCPELRQKTTVDHVLWMVVKVTIL